MKRILILAGCLLLVGSLAVAQGPTKNATYTVTFNGSSGEYEIADPAGSATGGQLIVNVSLPIEVTDIIKFDNNSSAEITVTNTGTPAGISQDPVENIPAGALGTDHLIDGNEPGQYVYAVSGSLGTEVELIINTSSRVPSLGTYGIIILLVLLTAATILVLRRRGRAVA